MSYIDGDKLIQELSTMYKEPTSTEDFMTIGYNKAIADVVVTTHRQPTADVPERNVGKWEKKWHSYFKQELPCCSVCGHFSAMRWKYCPNCGADMRGGPDAQLD